MNRSLRDKLAALEHSTGRASRAAVQTSDEAVGPSSRTQDALVEQGFHHHLSADGGYWKRSLRYDLLTKHGNGRFVDLVDAPFEPLFRAAKLTALDEGSSVQRFRFYDTETSGLGTGAGTFPFLHAVAWIDDDEVVLEQYFLADHSEEHALLRALWSEHFADRENIVVSYNGKSFDWPLLRSRLVMHRLVESDERLHVDLLPICRRLWKQKLTRVSLGHVEESVLHLTRADDLPGSEAPARYFAFVDDGDAGPLGPVFDHNAMDVCTLITLMAHIANIMSHRQTVDTSAEFVALARWHDEWGEVDLARHCYVSGNRLPDSSWTSLWLQSMHHKRNRQWDEAIVGWKLLAERFPWSVSPVVELAKYYEHRDRDYHQALAWAQEAVLRLKRSRRLQHGSANRFDGLARESTPTDTELAQLLHRQERIRGKMS